MKNNDKTSITKKNFQKRDTLFNLYNIFKISVVKSNLNIIFNFLSNYLFIVLQ